jgi:enterochelin esterase-like enzyme
MRYNQTMNAYSIGKILLPLVLVLQGCGGSNSSSSSPSTPAPTPTSRPESTLETISYTTTYQDTVYEKSALIYVPKGTRPDEPLDVLYVMHGSQMDVQVLADTLKPILDEQIESGALAPLLVVFPTYYPDSSFSTPDYFQDYPLVHHFAVEELETLMETVEGTYCTYASSLDDAGYTASRTHRLFAGYSMGSVTTWEVLAYHSDWFSRFMPMAGECWLDQSEDLQGVDEMAGFLVQNMEANGLTSQDFLIVAMIGEYDSTMAQMKALIEALRTDYPAMITDENLLFWENPEGDHSFDSMLIEMEHGLTILAPGSASSSAAP